MKLTATTFFGLEDILAEELDNLGAQQIEVLNRAVMFHGDMELLYKANLHLRTALRVLVPIERFAAANEDHLYREIRKVDWSRYISPKDTFAVDAVVSGKIFSHSHYVALKVKDAVVDQFRETTDSRPSIDTENPDLRINVHISGKHCNLSLDSSGTSLHRRGYRLDKNPAPLNEALAAAMVLISGWKGQSTFVDPMCGSGTILIEAAMIGMNLAPGLYRQHFGFMKWKDFDTKLWNNVLEEAQLQIRDLNAEMIGVDFSRQSIQAATANLKRARLHKEVELHQEDLRNFTPPAGGGMVITNPPYDERLKKYDINAFYKSIGDKLKQDYHDYTAWIISANTEAFKHIGLKASESHTLYNGPFIASYRKYELYKGSKED